MFHFLKQNSRWIIFTRTEAGEENIKLLCSYSVVILTVVIYFFKKIWMLKANMHFIFHTFIISPSCNLMNTFQLPYLNPVKQQCMEFKLGLSTNNICVSTQFFNCAEMEEAWVLEQFMQCLLKLVQCLLKRKWGMTLFC